jgi:hypothetical protein
MRLANLQGNMLAPTVAQTVRAARAAARAHHAQLEGKQLEDFPLLGPTEAMVAATKACAAALIQKDWRERRQRRALPGYHANRNQILEQLLGRTDAEPRWLRLRRYRCHRHDRPHVLRQVSRTWRGRWGRRLIMSGL